MNIIAITGNLTSDPEVKMTQNGDSVCSFTVAVKRPHTKDKTDFIDCVAWKNKAEFVGKYFSKGKKIELSGYISTRVYESQGTKRKATELICEDVSFGGKKDDEPKATDRDLSDSFEEELNDDGVPF